MASDLLYGGAITEYYPAPTKVDDEIPERPRTFLSQANASLHAPSGAIMLAASAIDAMLKDKGYTQGKLHSRIKQAASEHLITDGMAKWAHQVRLDANDQRHADENASLPTEQEAKQVIEFAMALATFLYVLPARVTRGLAAASTPESAD